MIPILIIGLLTGIIDHDGVNGQGSEREGMEFGKLLCCEVSIRNYTN